jgi:group I intron endonuclease
MEYIYIIENTNTGKFYLGRTNNPAARKRGHLSELRRNIHGNPRLQASFNKHGEKAFEFKVVDSAPSEIINDKEAEWFTAFDKNKEYLYNCHFETYGGPKISNPHTIESKLKTSETIKNGTRKYIFEILDERYVGASLKKLAKKYKVGVNTLLDYTGEWEKLRNLKMPKSVQSQKTKDNVELFVAAFECFGQEAINNIKKFHVSRKGLIKYLPEFGLNFNIFLKCNSGKQIA